jgi:hypothetical protein
MFTVFHVIVFKILLFQSPDCESITRKRSQINQEPEKFPAPFAEKRAA